MAGEQEGLVQNLLRAHRDQERRLRRLEAQEGRRFLTDYLWHRGWKDDFYGDVLKDQYTLSTNGAGSSGGFLGAHGGLYRLTAGNVNGFYTRLYLGDAADGYPSIRPENPWTMFGRLRHFNSGTAGAHRTVMSIRNAARTRYIDFGINTPAAGAQFVIQCDDGLGPSSTATGIVFDNAMHEFAMTCTDGTEIKCFIDGVHVCTHTTNIPTGAVYTPTLESYALGAVARALYVDFWEVVSLTTEMV